MIDVVFLLLVFFMLASRFGTDAVVPLPLVGSGGDYNGPPRLVDVGPAQISLNGIAVDQDALVDTLAPMMDTLSDLVILRGADGTTLQRVVTVTQVLRDAGLTSIVLVE